MDVRDPGIGAAAQMHVVISLFLLLFFDYVPLILLTRRLPFANAFMGHVLVGCLHPD